MEVLNYLPNRCFEPLMSSTGGQTDLQVRTSGEKCPNSHLTSTKSRCWSHCHFLFSQVFCPSLKLFKQTKPQQDEGHWRPLVKLRVWACVLFHRRFWRSGHFPRPRSLRYNRERKPARGAQASSAPPARTGLGSPCSCPRPAPSHPQSVPNEEAASH